MFRVNQLEAELDRSKEDLDSSVNEIQVSMDECSRLQDQCVELKVEVRHRDEKHQSLLSSLKPLINSIQSLLVAMPKDAADIKHFEQRSEKRSRITQETVRLTDGYFDELRYRHSMRATDDAVNPPASVNLFKRWDPGLQNP